MKLKYESSVLMLLMVIAITGIIVLLPSRTVWAETVIVTDTFTAGSVGNSVTFSVKNMTSRRVSGVRMVPQYPIQWSIITGITPEKATVEPGGSIDFTIEFSVLKDAPGGSKDTIRLFFDNNEAVKIDFPWYQINLNIQSADTDETNSDDSSVDNSFKYDAAYFVVRISGSGYTFTAGDGTHKISGSEERHIVVNREQGALEVLEGLKKIIDGVPCERLGPNVWGAEGVGHPSLFTSGSKITIIDGPYFDQETFFHEREFKKDWRINSKDGPHPTEMIKKFKCL